MASEPPVLTDDYGDKITLCIDPYQADGGVSPAGALVITFYDGDDGISMRLSGERLDALRELLDRAAMPGQPASGG